MRIKGKVAVVTGAGRGIGEGIALRFAAEGAKVICADLNVEDAKRTVREIKAKNGEAHAIKCDVSNSYEVDAMAKEVVNEYGTVDILVNNAGLIRDAQVKNMTEDMWDLVLDVNVKGPFLCSKADHADN